MTEESPANKGKLFSAKLHIHVQSSMSIHNGFSEIKLHHFVLKNKKPTYIITFNDYQSGFSYWELSWRSFRFKSRDM